MKGKTILIQGALDIEIQYLINNLNNIEKILISGYEFFIGYINNYKIIVSKILIGVINSTTATTIGIMKFNPSVVINQGIAGAHKDTIHIGDIIIGTKCCNINAYSIPLKAKGESSNPFEWEINKRAKDFKISDSNLLENFTNFFASNYENSIFTGPLGSGDIFNREFDRINWIHNKFGSLCEDMESIGTYTVCEKFNIPCIGIRIISNNELTNEKLDKEQAIELQKILLKYYENM